MRPWRSWPRSAPAIADLNQAFLRGGPGRCLPCVAILVALEDPEGHAYPALISAAQAPELPLRLAAIPGLPRYGPRTESQRLLRAILETKILTLWSKPRELRKVAALDLSTIDPDFLPSIPPLLAIIKGRASFVSEAFSALEAIGPGLSRSAKARKQLRQQLRGDQAVPVARVLLFAGLDQEAAAGVLLKEASSLHQREPEVLSGYAIRSLAELGNRARASIMRYARDLLDPDLQSAALFALGFLDPLPPADEAFVIEALGESRLRPSAAFALGAHSSTCDRALKLLLEDAAKSGTDAGRSLVALRWLWRRSPEALDRQLAIAADSSQPRDLRHAAIASLNGPNLDDRSEERLKDLKEDPDPELRRLVLQRLEERREAREMQAGYLS